MQNKLIELRTELFAALRSGERQKNRRALLLAYKHIDKAARILGAPRQDIPSRQSKAAQPQYVPQESIEAPEAGTVLADNSTPTTGPEKPVKARRK